MTDAQRFHELTGIELPENYTAADILNRMKEFCGQSKYNKFLWELGVDCVGRTQLEAINNFIEKYILNHPALLKKAVEFLEAYEKAQDK